MNDLRAKRQAVERYRRWLRCEYRTAKPTVLEVHGRLSSQGNAAKHVDELMDMEVENNISSLDERTKESRFEEERQFKKEDRLNCHPDSTSIL